MYFNIILFLPCKKRERPGYLLNAYSTLFFLYLCKKQ